jgi:hypothetical protein
MTKIILSILSFLIAGAVQAQEPRLATLAQQKMCAEQARKFFLDPEMERKTWVEYSSHYDTKLNVCYVMIRSDIIGGGKHSVAFQIFDAFEGVERGSMQSYIGGPPFSCSVRPSGQKRIYCKTDEEFDALVMKHFGIERP